MNTNSERDSIAVLGVSEHADFFVPLLREFEDVDLTAVWDYDVVKAETFARNHGIRRVLEKPEEALEYAYAGLIPIHGKPPQKEERYGDAPSDHLRLSRIFLEAGRPVFVDKPFSTELKDAEVMIELAKQHNAPLMSCSSLRYAREVQELAERARKGELGRLRSGFSTINTPLEVTLIYYGVHAAEMGYTVMGPGVESVYAQTSTIDETETKTYLVKVAFTNGSLLLIQLLEKVHPARYSLLVFGEKDSGESHPDPRYSIVPFNSEAAVEYEKDTFPSLSFPSYERKPENDYFRIMLHEYVTMVRTGRPPIPYDETMEITKLLVAAKKSLEKETKVYLSDF